MTFCPFCPPAQCISMYGSWPMLAPCPGSSLENWNLLWEVVLHIQSSCIKPLQQTVYLVTKLQKNLSPNGFGKDFFPFFHGSVIWVISNKCRRVTLSKDLFEKPLAATAVTVTCKRFHLRQGPTRWSCWQHAQVVQLEKWPCFSQQSYHLQVTPPFLSAGIWCQNHQISSNSRSSPTLSPWDSI